MKKQVDLKPKKPRLAYVGMDKKTIAEAIPTQIVEIVYPSKAEKTDEDTLFSKGQLGVKIKKSVDLPKNRLIWTNDNLVALQTLLDEKDTATGEYKYRNKIDLIYIDPPFMVQNDFVAQNTIDIEVDEEEGVMSVKEPTIIEIIAYKDTWQNGLDSFLQMMRERLELMKDLLASTGSIYVHLDWHAIHYIKVLMDEMFGYENYINDIIWKRQTAHSDYKQGAKHLGRIHDNILFYSKVPQNNYLKTIFTNYSKEYIESSYKNIDKDGRRYSLGDITGPGGERKGNPYYEFLGIRRYWAFSKEKMQQMYERDEIVQTKPGTVPRRKRYLDEMPGVPTQSIWDDIPSVQSQSKEKTGYPTQKPIELLRRILKASCPQKGIVLDVFLGSGTTCEAAEQLFDELNCSWIGIDNSKFAIHIARKRLIELNGKPKEKKNEGTYKVRPFTVENIGYYQRDVKWDPIQIGGQADAYRRAIIELFGGEYVSYSKLLHGKKRGAWVHVGPLSAPIIAEQIRAIAEEVKETEFKKVYVLSADFTVHNQRDIERIKEEFGVQVMVRLIPASAIEEVKKRLELMKQGAKEKDNIDNMPAISFFAPLTVKINTVLDKKEVMIELIGLEVDVESFLESQKPERQKELKKWLAKKKSWQSFVDFWAVDWNYEDLKDTSCGPIFENEWQSFRKRKGKKIVEGLVFKAFHAYDKAREYTIAVKVTDIFGNDGIITKRVIIK